MRMTLVAHIVAGAIAIIAGFVALSVAKGGTLHRRSGMAFVSVMLVMSASGAFLAYVKHSRLSVVAGVLTFYLVTTGVRSVARGSQESRWVDIAAMLVAFAVAVAGITMGVHALRLHETLDGLPAVPAVVFGTVALLGALGDAWMVTHGVHGAKRIARHLWRLCFALLIATSSFFLGQAKVIPAPLRVTWLLRLPVLLVLVLMLYWLARVLGGQWRFRGASYPAESAPQRRASRIAAAEVSSSSRTDRGFLSSRSPR